MSVRAAVWSFSATARGYGKPLRPIRRCISTVREHAVPHILNLSVKNVKGTVFQRAMSEKGVCVSVKSACSADGLPSRAVFAVSRDRRNALSSWRISLSHLTTDAEIDEFLSVFDACYHELVK